MKKLSPERVVARIEESRRSLHSYRKKIWDLRRLAAGDQSALDAVLGASGQQDDGQDAFYGDIPDLYDVLITDVASGRSNRILQHVRTLAMQTVYRFPEVEFEDLDPDMAAVNAQYLKVRLGPPPLGTNARDHMRLALMDYLIGGPGWVYIGLHENRPRVQWCDALRMAWDPTAKHFGECAWVSAQYTNSLSYWTAMFGVGAMKKVVKEPQEPKDLDRPVTVEFYYDVEGNYQAYAVDGDGLIETPVYRGESPFYYEMAGKKTFCLPFESVAFMTLPSVRLPIGLVEQMLPNQIALWEAEKRIRDDIVSGRGLREFEEGAYDPEQIEKWESGDSDYLVRKTGTQPMHIQPSSPPDPAVINWALAQDKQMVAMSGADPFASGSPVEGVQYAAEVNAIQSSASLMSGNIAKDNAEFWQRVVRKVLAFGKVYDSEPIEVSIGPVKIAFTPEQPISDMLEPNTTITVREDSTTFKPREKEIQEASMLLGTSLQVASLYPNAVGLAFEKVLRAFGEKNVAKWLEAPAPAAPIGMQEGSAGDEVAQDADTGLM